MSEPDISPLARRLAEENNVEWRVLHGSGGGGKVVERDVLEYLARVMAGDEDLDPTPEPLPDGMQAWPEDELGGFQRGIQSSGRGSELEDIQRELSAADRSYDSGVGDASLAAAASPHAPADLDEISEDIFLFDDDDAEAEERDAVEYGAASRAPIDDLDDGLLIAGDDSAGDTEADSVEDDLLWSGASAASQPDSLPDIFEEETEPDPALASEHVEDEESLDLFTGPGEEIAAGGTTELDIPSYDQLDMDAAPVVQAPVVQAPVVEAPVVEAPVVEAPVVEAPVVGATVPTNRRAGEVADLSEPSHELDDGIEAVSEPDGWREPDPDAWVTAPREDAGRDLGESHQRVAVDPMDVTAQDRDLSGPTADATRVEAEPEPRETVVSAEADETPMTVASAAVEGLDERTDVEPWIAPVAAAEASADAMPAVMTDAATVPLVRYGSMLRRHLDLTSLAGAQLAVSQEFGEEDPLLPTAFLVRAAAKAMAAVGWEGRTLLADFSDGDLHLSDVGSLARGAFRSLSDAVRAERGEAVPAEGAALVIADMSGLDVDEAVLNVGAPVLTLGRILYDNQRGSYRSTLTISGDVPPERGAKLLAKAAELLDTPIRLVL